MHDALLSGHLGVRRTKERICQRYYWFNLKQDVKWYVRKCDVCAADKTPPKLPKAPMGHLKSGAPWDTLAIDYLGPLPRTPRGNRYILVLTDQFTKYVEVFAMPDQTAEDCALKIMNEFIARWGTPLKIHSDQGSTFESKVFRHLCDLLGVKKTRTSPRNPRGNGQTERFNRTLLKMIKAYLTDEQEDWDLYLGCLAGAYRATPSEATRLSPNMLSLGREVRLPADLIFGHASIDSRDGAPEYCEHVDILRDRMLHAHEIARKFLKSNAKRSKETYDINAVSHNYCEGDIVWCLQEARKVGVSPKLEKRYDGPFLVKKKLSAINFEIQLNKDGQSRLVHHNKLKRYEGDNPPKWAIRALQKLKNSK